MPGWTEFIMACAAFFLSHAIPVRPAIKGAIVARIGARGFSLAFSVLSILALGWVIVAAGRAPVVDLWPLTPVLRWIALALMLVASVILALAIGRPNPFSFGGRPSGSTPTAPASLDGPAILCWWCCCCGPWRTFWPMATWPMR